MLIKREEVYMEKLLWEWFNKTGRLDLYLLYRDFIEAHDCKDFYYKKQEKNFLSNLEEKLL